ncbi:MAG: transketolase [Firmicutes bacterium]|jgi:transketolase|nr:transketolase [Bacillota bacterium]NLL88801.1 transketolase [Bacillota bacterium]
MKEVICLANLKLLAEKAVQTRIAILQMIYQGKGGHIGGALSCTDILVTLYYTVMRIDPKNPGWEGRDRFVLSKGHSVEGLYAILADLGFIPRAELDSYRGFGSRLIGHPSNKVPGIEVNTGALGHGLSVGVGMALAGKMDQKDHKVYVLMGDGELAEGSVWEAAMAGSHYKLDNLIGIVDRNRLQIGGSTEDVMALEDLKAKWQAFGWEALEVDGHDFNSLVELAKLPIVPGKPHMIIANTIKGKGISFMENEVGWHHRVPNEEEYAQALQELELRMGAF